MREEEDAKLLERASGLRWTEHRPSRTLLAKDPLARGFIGRSSEKAFDGCVIFDIARSAVLGRENEEGRRYVAKTSGFEIVSSKTTAALWVIAEREGAAQAAHRQAAHEEYVRDMKMLRERGPYELSGNGYVVGRNWVFFDTFTSVEWAGALVRLLNRATRRQQAEPPFYRGNHEVNPILEDR